MYNGIGLPTPRGSGTNGYVQRNLVFISSAKEKQVYKTDDDVKRADAAFFKEPNKEILEHERKRKIELKCFELEQAMEEQGYTEAEVTKKVSAFRSKLLEEMKAEDAKKNLLRAEPVAALETETGRLVPKGTHETAAINLLKNSIFKEALGIGSDFQDGNSMEQVNQRRKEAMEAKKLIDTQKKLSTLESSSDDDSEHSEKPKKRSTKTKKSRKRSSSYSSSSSDSEDEQEARRHHSKKHRHSDKSCTKRRRRSRSGERRRHRH